MMVLRFSKFLTGGFSQIWQAPRHPARIICPITDHPEDSTIRRFVQKEVVKLKQLSRLPDQDGRKNDRVDHLG